VRAGSIKAHAVLAKSRLNSLPDIPTVEEGGVAGLHVSSWQAIWAPKGTPKSVVDKVNAAALYALADPATRGLLSEMSQEVPPREEQSADALGALQDAEIAKWWPLIKAAGIKAE
jgi:tripartite-type tricarboxylate transporter receptor subunit TctC